MPFSIDWCWFALVLCLQFMGGGADQICTEENLQIEGGDYTLTKGLRTNSKLEYRCPQHYYPYPDLVRLCLPTGTWKPRPRFPSRQMCRLVECPDPTVLEQGSIDPLEEKYYVGNETTYECWSGYTLRGSASRVCQPNGKWSGTTPICSQDTYSKCADPGVPAGTRKAVHTSDKVTYSCLNNLLLVGSRERVCQENGQWTGMEPACYYRHTYDTAQEVSEAFGTSIRMRLTELKHLEDMQEGPKIRIPKNDKFNVYIAIDVSTTIRKSQFEDARAAVTKLITKISTFSISPNYEIFFFSAQIFEIVNIKDFFSANKPRGIREKLQTFDTGEDHNGTDLTAAFRTIRERMAWIKQNTNESFVDHRHVIILFTDGGYNTGGSPKGTVAQIKHMVYQKAGQLDEENRKEYLDIYVFAIGSDIFDEDLKPLTAPEDSPDKHYFRMKEVANLAHAFDDVIDEDHVVGLCGLYISKDKDVYSNDWAAYQYPWKVEINIGTRNCFGSLVSKKFVLTAAHCFTFEDEAEHIRVYTSDLQGRNVNKIFLHPEYDVRKRVDQGVLEFYDYDVALLKLTTKVILSPHVRPICIPGTQATSDALKLVGVSTRRQQEERLLNKEIERLAFLTKNTNNPRNIEKDVHAKLGRFRDDCIKNAKHAYGVTTEDVTLAVTDNFICTGGKTPRIDHIACPGDGGGALFKEYERRMIQIAVVSWGVQDMCTTGESMPRSNRTSRDFHINLFRVVDFLENILADEDQWEYSPMQFLDN